MGDCQDINYPQLNVGGSQASRITASDSPFLKLPVELRYYVYSYLLPNDIIPARHDTSTTSVADLRKDGEKCSIAIMRVNKLLYQETLDYLYNACTIELDIDPYGIHFCADGGTPITLRSGKLAAFFKFFRRIEFVKFWDDDPEEYKVFEPGNRVKDFTNVFIDSMLHQNQRPLKLHLTYYDDRPLLGSREYNEDHLLDLKWHMQPFLKLRGIRAVHAHYQRHPENLDADSETSRLLNWFEYEAHLMGQDDSRLRLEESQRMQAEILAEMQQFLDNLASTMEETTPSTTRPCTFTKRWSQQKRWMEPFMTKIIVHALLSDEILTELAKEYYHAWEAQDESNVQIFLAASAKIDGIIGRLPEELQRLMWCYRRWI
ncbi:hypothetical protein NA57DRAFT_60982 [Rhizodiscina lignyota]|uniref:F-box domain-containing protein n=1 Tax=Rhizodiscina lignyota TaxID=1504668 RepID=A0A9P4M1N5_9PEZI|nr:hypothetical protein NA57DRAFT_60982 [Rhizodiscina lignyota]